MGTFFGNKEEFKKYFGVYCRNKVHEITNPYRKSCGGICEYCKKKSELQAAHIRGFERVKLIESILDKSFKKGDNEYLVDLDKFENEFIEAHKPIEQKFHFLCSACHAKYDQDLLSEEQILSGKGIKTNSLSGNKVNSKSSQSSNSIPIVDNGLYKNEDESIQNYVKRLLENLFFNNLLSEELINQLQNKEYCKLAFDINYPLLEQDVSKIKPAGRARYYTTFKLDNKYYVCKEWWKDNFSVYERKLKDWVSKIIERDKRKQIK